MAGDDREVERETREAVAAAMALTGDLRRSVDDLVKVLNRIAKGDTDG